MKKKLLRIALIILLMLPFLAFAHFLAFPQETRCMLITYANFEKTGNIYYRKNTSTTLIRKLQQLQGIAEKNDRAFWKENYEGDYKIIFCSSPEDYDKYGVSGSPACTQRKAGVSLVISIDGLDSSIIAHELSHGILYNNIGWYKTTFRIPVWFDEGLAMQTDDRAYYSLDTLAKKQQAGLQLPDVTKLSTASLFFQGTNEQVMLNFSTAKYEVHEWLKTHALHKFIERIKAGETFEKAYRGKN